MTERARQVLDDARAAVSAHREDLFGPAFRICWFTVVGLLRSVGHVLGKVDSTHSPEMAAAIARAWSRLVESKPEPAIFWGFIDSERNRFLKNYEHGITRMRIFRSSGPSPQVLAVDLANASAKVAQFVTAVNMPEHVPDRSVISVLASGSFEGKPDLEVATEAITWWEQYLLKIELEAESSAVA